MRLALILNAIDPSIGGVLVCGRRGTGKSTAVRALTDLLPTITGVADCPYFCDSTSQRWMCTDCQSRLAQNEILPLAQRSVPLVTLPLNASEDRVAGSFDLATALESGKSHFAPGLLALANRGFLYVDEINLLNDSIIDLLLDAAALGVNRVERDTVSTTHPAHFVLIGTMNPEEGGLRPQLLDRIGLYADAEDMREPAIRATVVERRLAYDADPLAFCEKWTEAEHILHNRISRAQALLPTVRISAYLRQVIAVLVDKRLHAEGHRGDIVVLRTARALAAWDNRAEVTQGDVEQAANLAMPHRMRNDTSINSNLCVLFSKFRLPQITMIHRRSLPQSMMMLRSKSALTSKRVPLASRVIYVVTLMWRKFSILLMSHEIVSHARMLAVVFSRSQRVIVDALHVVVRLIP